jgi:Family of unknown function (DUF6527)
VKIHEIKDEGKSYYMFDCPGCGYGHPFEVPPWTWNGSFDKPTFSPSLVCNGFDPESRCHCIVADGKIHFGQDCWHSLAGQIVDMLDWK